MLLPRSLYTDSPPERRTRLDNNPTLLYSWWCTLFSLAIILIRLSGRYVRNERLFREDRIMALSIIPLLARMGCVHVVLIFGTNNVDIDGLVDPVRIHHREIGSKLVLAARIFYALFIWTAKFTVSEFLKRMTERFWKRGYEHGLRCIRAFLVLTFIGVFIATLAECQPFDHHWQVIPPPAPRCRQGYAHLLTMGITDIITDILLIIFPIPIIIFSGMPIRRKLSLVALFSLSVVLIAITGARIPLVIERGGLQQFRTVMASSEILAATFVSNAIILGSFLRDRGIKKTKYKANPGAGSTTDSLDRRSSIRRPTQGALDSDEDLARSLGFRTNPELSDRKSNAPRPAPVADLTLLGPSGSSRPFANHNWKFPDLESGNVDEDQVRKPTPAEDPLPSPKGGRRVSFLGSGQTEEGSHPSTAPSLSDSIVTHDFATTQPRRESKASNSVIPNGRAYPPNRRSSRLSQQSTDYDASLRNGQQLQDLGGSLRRQSGTSGTANPPPSHISLKPIRRTSNAPSFGSLPSIQDAGGLLSFSSK